jgi:hypothetical protein
VAVDWWWKRLIRRWIDLDTMGDSDPNPMGKMNGETKEEDKTVSGKWRLRSTMCLQQLEPQFNNNWNSSNDIWRTTSNQPQRTKYSKQNMRSNPRKITQAKKKTRTWLVACMRFSQGMRRRKRLD